MGATIGNFSQFRNETQRLQYLASYSNNGVVVSTRYGVGFATRTGRNSNNEYVPCNVSVDYQNAELNVFYSNYASIRPVIALSSSDSTALSGIDVYYVDATGTLQTMSSSAPAINSAVWDVITTSTPNFAIPIGTPSSTAPDGITDQTGATLPDTSSWDTPENTLASLQQQYPNMFNNAMVWDDDFGDTVGNTRTYIPVPMPYIDGNYNQPVSINPDNAQQQQTQPDTSIDPTITPEVLTQIIAEIVQQTKTQTQPDTETPPANPTDTGTGEPSPLVPPVGTASALWSVYHPTQAQINQFGAWLWTDNIIEQFVRLMNNPMEGIISLHRVFVTPVDSGNGTIVVGRLDSNVPTATVTQQYVYVDCGTVNLNEQFANVFDYAPYTNVSLYLPFVGIVGLNVSDIMRSSINVNYGVDVFTGACLAMVRVTRDGNTVNLYQYTGVASVQYPLTGAQNSGLLNGLFGIASGVGSIAMGNVAGGAAMVAGGAVNALHTNMSRSGGFSGNAGAMGIKTPYLIIERPQTQIANTFPNQQGYPTNYSATLGDYTGFVQCRALHTDGIAATHDELAEIRRYLETGVIV